MRLCCSGIVRRYQRHVLVLAVPLIWSTGLGSIEGLDSPPPKSRLEIAALPVVSDFTEILNGVSTVEPGRCALRS